MCENLIIVSEKLIQTILNLLEGQWVCNIEKYNIWIPSWRSKKQKELENQKKEPEKKFIFLVIVGKVAKKFPIIKGPFSAFKSAELIY